MSAHFCVCIYVLGYTCMCMYAEARDWYQMSSSIAIHLTLLYFILKQGLSLSSESSLHLPSTSVIEMHNDTCFFLTCTFETGTRILMIVQQILQSTQILLFKRYNSIKVRGLGEGSEGNSTLTSGDPMGICIPMYILTQETIRNKSLRYYIIILVTKRKLEYLSIRNTNCECQSKSSAVESTCCSSLPKDLHLVPNTHIRKLTSVYDSTRSDTLFCPLQTPWQDLLRGLL